MARPSSARTVPLSEHEALRIQLAEANARVSALTVEVGRLADLVARSNDRITELLAIAQRKKRDPKKDTKPKPPVAPPSLDEAARVAFDTRPAAPELPKKKAKRKKKQVPTGRKPLPDHLEEENHALRPDVCAHCGCDDLENVDEVVERKLHTVKEHIRCRVVRRKTCCCKRCGERTTARSLPAPFARSKATCEWLAWLVHQKFVMLIPLDRVRRDLATRGIELAMSYLVTQIERAADLIDLVDGEHWKQLLAGRWMATDATGLKVLVPQLPGTHGGHLEVYRRDATVVFQYEAHKGGEVLEQKLAGFSGVLVADAEHRHNPVFASGRIIEAGCNAHGRRRFEEAESVQPVLAKEGGAFIAAIFVAEAEAQKRKLVGDELRAWRREKVPPLRDELLRWMDAVEPTLTPDDLLAKTIRYYRNHWDALFRFIDHPEIPMDNSGSSASTSRSPNCAIAVFSPEAPKAPTVPPSCSGSSRPVEISASIPSATSAGRSPASARIATSTT